MKIRHRNRINRPTLRQVRGRSMLRSAKRQLKAFFWRRMDQVLTDALAWTPTDNPGHKFKGLEADAMWMDELQSDKDSA